MRLKLEQGKSAEQLRLEREKRVTDTIQLKMADRVPIICRMGYFPGKVAGIPFSAAYYDYKAWYNAYKTVLPGLSCRYDLSPEFHSRENAGNPDADHDTLARL